MGDGIDFVMTVFITLSVSSFSNIFSHSVGCVFIVFRVSFAMQKLLSLIRSHLLIFVFTSINLGDTAMIYIREYSSYDSAG